MTEGTRFSTALCVEVEAADAAIDVRGLIFDVQHKPELDARIGNRDFDTTLACVVYGSRHVRVLIDVKHAPDLVEVLIAAPGPASSS